MFMGRGGARVCGEDGPAPTCSSHWQRRNSTSYYRRIRPEALQDCWAAQPAHADKATCGEPEWWTYLLVASPSMRTWRIGPIVQDPCDEECVDRMVALRCVVCLMVCGRLCQVGLGGAPRRALQSCIEHWAALCNASAAVPTAASLVAAPARHVPESMWLLLGVVLKGAELHWVAHAVCITWDRLLEACLPATLSLQCSWTEPALLPVLRRVRT